MRVHDVCCKNLCNVNCVYIVCCYYTEIRKHSNSSNLRGVTTWQMSIWCSGVYRRLWKNSLIYIKVGLDPNSDHSRSNLSFPLLGLPLSSTLWQSVHAADTQIDTHNSNDYIVSFVNKGNKFEFHFGSCLSINVKCDDDMLSMIMQISLKKLWKKHGNCFHRL